MASRRPVISNTALRNLRYVATRLVCMCVHTCVSVCLCACVRACVRACHNEKEVPDEWQARQATPAILQVSSSKHSANKNTTRGRGPFHQSIMCVCVCVCVCACVRVCVCVCLCDSFPAVLIIDFSALVVLI